MTGFVSIRFKDRDYRVYLHPEGGLRGRVCGLQVQNGKVCERELTSTSSQQRRELLATARRIADRS